ncbi:uncharacterized protein GGS22DRAFT_193590 [Annulohypoxylon maeteangense]|uniref:uncharacterized protein n=1 Tax=Annulohypoxylon maeteangense TaxID=1927788 RepID=UPI0020082500|nr:uncharacterized protein GGS22DRAFT_193590 [Annulohypoxylon maeteangense]KAI0880116.1 hypothetical protein GGS22DRAFT_193590 [Annulohypoxylon maeteangense]
MSDNESLTSTSNTLEGFVPSSPVSGLEMPLSSAYHTPIPMKSKASTTYGILPPELWIIIRDILEVNDDRATLAALVRCNAGFQRLLQAHLYKRFITNSYQTRRPRSLAGFIQTVSKLPHLASLVKVVAISTMLANDDPFLINGVGGFPRFLADMNPQLALHVLSAISGYQPFQGRFQTTLTDLLPTLLPNLEYLYTHSTIANGTLMNNSPDIHYMVPWSLSYARLWGMQDSNRMTSLTSLIVTHDKPTFLFTPFLIIAQWAKVAPNLQSFGVQTNAMSYGQANPFILKQIQRLPNDAPLAAALDRIQEFQFQCDEHEEALECFHFMWRCSNLKRVSLEMTKSYHLNEESIRGRCFTVSNTLWHRGPSVLEPALSPAELPVPLNNTIPCSGLFTVRLRRSLHFLSVNQNMLMFAAMMRHNHHRYDRRIASMVVNFIPITVKILFVTEIDLRGMPAI